MRFRPHFAVLTKTPSRTIQLFDPYPIGVGAQPVRSFPLKRATGLLHALGISRRRLGARRPTNDLIFPSGITMVPTSESPSNRPSNRRSDSPRSHSGGMLNRATLLLHSTFPIGRAPPIRPTKRPTSVVKPSSQDAWTVLYPLTPAACASNICLTSSQDA